MMYQPVWRTASPFVTDDLFRLGRDWHRTIDRLFGTSGGYDASRFGERLQLDWTPPADVVETSDEYRINFDLPGMTSEDIEVTVHDNVLKVRGERKLELSEGREHDTYYCRERRYGRFERNFNLPSSVAADQMQAEYRNGVLSIVLPKDEKAKMRRIEIKGAGEQARLGSGK